MANWWARCEKDWPAVTWEYTGGSCEWNSLEEISSLMTLIWKYDLNARHFLFALYLYAYIDVKACEGETQMVAFLNMFTTKTHFIDLLYKIVKEICYATKLFYCLMHDLARQHFIGSLISVFVLCPVILSTHWCEFTSVSYLFVCNANLSTQVLLNICQHTSILTSCTAVRHNICPAFDQTNKATPVQLSQQLKTSTEINTRGRRSALSRKSWTTRLRNSFFPKKVPLLSSAPNTSGISYTNLH